MSLEIVALASHHRREAFDCGVEVLNEFLRRYARQQQDRDFSRTYVALAEDKASAIAFVTVSAGQVAAASFPGEMKLPRYPVPVLRIGRLAVDRRAQGRELGRELMRFALGVALDAAARLGVHAVVVDAKDERSRAFYGRLGFTSFRDARLSMFLPVATLRRAAGES